MAKTKPDEPAVPETLPQSGGSYLRTDTGALIPNIPPPQAPAADALAVSGDDGATQE